MSGTALNVEGLQSSKNARTTRSLATLLGRINDSIPLRARADLAPYVNWKGNAAFPIHRWLRYREAYSPHLVDKLSLGDKILDPFCGCGSIMIGAAQSGCTSVGIDINPLAVFAARVKLTPLAKTKLRSIKSFADGLPAEVSRAQPLPPPGLSVAGKVFEPVILDSLLRIRGLIESRFAGERGIRDFLHLAWVAILERVGSYFKEGNGIKYRNRRRIRGGYVRRPEGRWQEERFGPDQRQCVLDTYLTQLQMMLHDTRYWKTGRWTNQAVIEGNVLEMDRLLAGRKFNSIVFSPPYANRFDYFESMKVELWFGGFVNSYQANNRLRKVSLRSHLGADLSRHCDPIASLERLIDLMDRDASSWRMGVPDLLRGYFDDMRVMLKHCRNVLKDGRCFIVVGNSAFAGVIIPTDVLLAKIGLECGFRSAEILVTRHLTVAPQQRNHLASLEGHMRESVVVLS